MPPKTPTSNGKKARVPAPQGGAILSPTELKARADEVKQASAEMKRRLKARQDALLKTRYKPSLVAELKYQVVGAGVPWSVVFLRLSAVVGALVAVAVAAAVALHHPTAHMTDEPTSRACLALRRGTEAAQCFQRSPPATAAAAANANATSTCLAPEAGACFFSPTYEEARALFRAQAKAAGADVFSLPPVGSAGGDLVTDVAVLRGTSPNAVLLHLSGVHGVEGYAGSAIQSAALHLLQKTRLAPTVVFVHAVNPYGMKHSRRVNEDNIDLNRNFLTDEEFAAVHARDANYARYVDVDPVINPTTQVSTVPAINDVYNAVKTAVAVLRFGLVTLKRAMVSGNYHKQRGLGFGGFRRAASTNNLIHLVQERLNVTGSTDVRAVVLLDVHTGLGPTAVDTRFASSTADVSPEAVHAVLEQAFPGGRHEVDNKFGGEQIGDNATTAAAGGRGGGVKDDDVGAGYELTVGLTTKGFCRHFLCPPHLAAAGGGPDKLLCVTQEFGTVDPVVVGRNLVAENYAHHYGTPAEKAMYGRRLRESFYLSHDATWKERVVQGGLELLFQGVAYLDGLARA
jgi:hypothetical protein